MTYRRLSAVALAGLLAACSPVAHSPGALVPQAPSGAGAPSEHRLARVTLVIHVPRHRHARHGPRYVSPNTKSAAIAVHPANGCGRCSPGIALNVNVAACTTCRLAFLLAPGTYLGSITTYDGALVANKPTGNVLSLNRGFPLKVAAGEPNAPSIVLDGVPTALTFLTLTPSTIVSNGTSFEMVATSSIGRVAAYAVDPDGNVIVGPGAPAFAVAATGGFTASASDNVIAIGSPAKLAGGSSTLSVAAISPACTLAGSVCSYKVSVGFVPIVAVANSGDNSVLVFRAFVAGAYATITNAISDPVALAFDSDGNLFVANHSSKKIEKYAPPYSGAPEVTIATYNGDKPLYIAVAPNGALAVSDNQGTIVTYAPSTYAQRSVLHTSYPATAVTFDASNDLWIAPSVMAGNGGERYPSPAYATANVELPTDLPPETIAFDATGDAYVAYGGAQALIQYTVPTYSTGIVLQSLPPIASSAVASDEPAGVLALCTQTGLEVYAVPTLTLLSQSAAASNCVPAFDRDADIWTVYPTLGVVAGYRPIGTSWVPLQAFPANGPTAIAAFPAP